MKWVWVKLLPKHFDTIIRVDDIDCLNHRYDKMLIDTFAHNYFIKFKNGNEIMISKEEYNRLYDLLNRN